MRLSFLFLQRRYSVFKNFSMEILTRDVPLILFYLKAYWFCLLALKQSISRCCMRPALISYIAQNKLKRKVLIQREFLNSIHKYCYFKNMYIFKYLFKQLKHKSSLQFLISKSKFPSSVYCFRQLPYNMYQSRRYLFHPDPYI